MPLPVFHSEQLERLLQREYLPSEVRERLGWFLHFCRCRSISSTCRTFGIARTRFYRWASRFDPNDLSTLENLPNMLMAKSPALFPMTGPSAVTTDTATHSTPSVPVPPQAHVCTCITCRLRCWWRVSPVRRTLVIASILINLVVLWSLLATAFVEQRTVRALKAATSDTTVSEPTNASPSSLYP